MKPDHLPSGSFAAHVFQDEEGNLDQEKKLSPLAYESMDGEKYPPYVPPEKEMKEFTWTAVILGVLLAIILGAANAYLGLRVGMTVSASIPAAVISMGILRGLLRRGTILENNIVQTIGSAGESVAAGVIFTIPALYLLDLAPKMVMVTLIAGLGGILGLLMMIPLRRSVIVKEHGKLPFPEGTACAEVLVAGDSGGGSAKLLFSSMGVAGLYRAIQKGLGIFPESVEYAIGGYPGSMIGAEVLPSLLGVGFIVGIRIAAVMLLGSIISWLCLMPLIKFFGSGNISVIYPSEVPIMEMSPWDLWDNYIRYIGAGAVIFGGLTGFVEAFPTIIRSFKRVLSNFSMKKIGVEVRTKQDLPGAVVMIGSLVLALALLFIIPIQSMQIRIIAAVAVVVFSFFFVTVASRIVGLVGSSNSPVSGMTIATLLLTAVIVKVAGISGASGMTASIVAGAIVCIALASAGDMSQDLKTGFLVGATPRYQQIAEIIGVLATALVIGYILSMLNTTYGYGTQELPAPQATLMSMVVQGIFHGNLPWLLILMGAALGLGIRLIGLPVLAFGVGLYLPIHLNAAIFIGGVIRAIVMKRYPKGSQRHRKVTERGMLIGSGLVAGGAIVALLVAVLTYFQIDSSIHVGGPFEESALFGLGMFMLLAGYLYFGVIRKTQGKKE